MDADKAASILKALEAGASLRKACSEVGLTSPAVLKWVKNDPDGFGKHYAEARQIGYQLLADQILEISDDSSGDVVETENGSKVNPEFVARSRLRVDTRKWMLAKMLPKIYGDKIDHNISGGFTVTLTPPENGL